MQVSPMFSAIFSTDFPSVSKAKLSEPATASLQHPDHLQNISSNLSNQKIPFHTLNVSCLKALTFGSQTLPKPPRRTQIIATLGPASTSPEKIRALIQAGVNVFRLNFSHGNQTQHGTTVDTIRTESQALQKPVSILADMQGPKIRVGKLPQESLNLVVGSEVALIAEETTQAPNTIPTTYAGIVNDVDPSNTNSKILLDDGKLELKPLRKENNQLICQVVRGGTLTNKKGINLPGVNVSCPSLSEKDQSDIRFALEKGVDYIAMSFVRTANDIKQCRTLIQSTGKDVPIIAKIEKPEALTDANMVPIIQEADGIMVARGDLGVEVDITQLPQIQKKLIKAANQLSKPVIVATQMLESMMNNSQPSRADVTDIANAVADGADILMLSGETSVGQYPVEAVQMMSAIIQNAELPNTEVTPVEPGENGRLPIWQTYSETFQSLLKTQQIQGVAAYIDVSTVRRCLPTPIQTGWKVIAFTHNEKLFKQLSLVKGVEAVLVPNLSPPNENLLPTTAGSQKLLLQDLLKSRLMQAQPNALQDKTPWVLLGGLPQEGKQPWFSVEDLNS